MHRSSAVAVRAHVFASVCLVLAGCGVPTAGGTSVPGTAAPVAPPSVSAATPEPVATLETVGITRTAIPRTTAPAQLTLPCVHDAVDGFFAAPPENWGRLAWQGQALGGATLVDVRDPEEYARQTVTGAINVPLHELARRTGLLPGKDAALIVIAGDTHRAALGLLTLRLMGYGYALSLDGDFATWQAGGLPLAPGTAGPLPPAPAPAAADELLAALDRFLAASLADRLGAIDAETMQAGLADLSATGGIPPLVVDVRSPELYATGSVTRAINVPLGELVVRFDDVRIGHFKTT